MARSSQVEGESVRQAMRRTHAPVSVVGGPARKRGDPATEMASVERPRAPRGGRRRRVGDNRSPTGGAASGGGGSVPNAPSTRRGG